MVIVAVAAGYRDLFAFFLTAATCLLTRSGHQTIVCGAAGRPSPGQKWPEVAGIRVGETAHLNAGSVKGDVCRVGCCINNYNYKFVH